MHSFIKFLLNIYCCGPGSLCSIKRRWFADMCSQCSVMRALASYMQGTVCAHREGTGALQKKWALTWDLCETVLWEELEGFRDKKLCVWKSWMSVGAWWVGWGEYCHGPKGRTKWWLALDSMSVPPFKFIYCSPYPHCDGIWRWDLVKVVRLWGWSPCYGISAHIRRNVRERMSLT